VTVGIIRRMWNTLPVQLRHCDSLGQFKRLLKTYLFGGWDHGALWHLLGAPCISYITYLLTYLLTNFRINPILLHISCPWFCGVMRSSYVFNMLSICIHTRSQLPFLMAASVAFCCKLLDVNKSVVQITDTLTPYCMTGCFIDSGLDHGIFWTLILHKVV